MIKRFFFVILLLFILSIPSYAGKYDITVGANLAFITRADNLWGNGHKTITSIYAKPKATTIFLPVPFFNVKVTPGGDGPGKGALDFYINTVLEPGSLSIGLTNRLQKSFVDVHGFYSFLAKNWQNPYALYRRSTRTEFYGGKITFGNILDTSFSLSYKIAFTNIDKDLIGNLNSDLRQDGITHTGSISYSHMLTKTVSLVPELFYEKGDFDGKSNGYNSYGGSLGLDYRRTTFILNTRVYGRTAKFDKVHPLYFRTRDENTYGATAIATFLNPFGLKKYLLSLGANGNKTNSNITFFDKYGIVYFAIVGYKF
ncbi:MAG: DUF2860 family protein [Proteobacteria bacterium]|nr:DUF2860 family protein [Pseudomonadota bacterium]